MSKPKLIAVWDNAALPRSRLLSNLDTLCCGQCYNKDRAAVPSRARSANVHNNTAVIAFRCGHTANVTVTPGVIGGPHVLRIAET